MLVYFFWLFALYILNIVSIHTEIRLIGYKSNCISNNSISKKFFLSNIFEFFFY